MSRKAVVIGSTGLTGSQLIKKLLEDPAIESVTSISRRGTGIRNSKLRECLVRDFSSLNEVKEQAGGNIYFNCLGTTIRKAGSQDAFRSIDYDAAMEFARIAKSFDANAFISISAMGANESSPFFYNRVKGELDKDLQSLNFKSLVIFRPALLIGDRKEHRAAERAFLAITKPLLHLVPDSFGRRVGTDVDRLADRMIELAKISPVGNQIIEAKDI